MFHVNHLILCQWYYLFHVNHVFASAVWVVSRESFHGQLRISSGRLKPCGVSRESFLGACL